MYKIIEDLSEVSHLSNTHPLFSDTESDGLYINLRLLQVFQPDVNDLVYILDTDILDETEITNWLAPKHAVWYNSAYDLGLLNLPMKKFDDLFFAVRTAYPSFREYPLDKVIDKMGYTHFYKDIDKKAMQKEGFKKGVKLTADQYKYAATDCIVLNKMYKDAKIQAVIANNKAYQLDVKSQYYAIRYQQNGIPMHQASVAKEKAIVDEKIAEIKPQLGCLNVNSPKQCKKVLGTPSTNKETLIHLITEDKGAIGKTAKLIYDQRRHLKRKNLLDSYSFPVVETRFNVAGAITGRFTSTGGNLRRGINSQQIPRALKYLIQPPKGYVIVKGDYPTIELRFGCAIFKEPNMYAQLVAKIDLHKAVAAEVQSKRLEDVTKDERQKAKAVNFGFIFGMSDERFKEYAFVEYGVVFTTQEAKEAKAKYFTMYPNIKKYHGAVWEGVKRGTYVYRTAMGRVVKPKLGTDGINGPVQGSTAECTKLAIHYAAKETNEKILEYIINVVHDEIILCVPEEQEAYWSDVLKRNMEEAWKQISKASIMHYKDIPMEVEIEYVRYQEVI